MNGMMLRWIQYFALVSAVCALCGSAVYASPITPYQQAFASQLSTGQFYYPRIESGPLTGKPALYEYTGTAGGSSDGWFRSLLKATTVGLSGTAGFLIAGPGGAAIGVGASGTYVTSLNAAGPPPGKQWLISDARIFDSVNVDGTGDILPSILSASLSNIDSTIALSPTLALSFVSPSFINVSVKDTNLQPIGTIDLAQAFILSDNSGSTTKNYFGSFVLNSVGFPNSQALTDTDLIKVDVGSLLSVADGTPVTIRSSLIVGVTTVPEPSTIALIGLGLAGMSFRRNRLRRAHLTHKADN